MALSIPNLVQSAIDSAKKAGIDTANQITAPAKQVKEQLNNSAFNIGGSWGDASQQGLSIDANNNSDTNTPKAQNDKIDFYLDPNANLYNMQIEPTPAEPIEEPDYKDKLNDFDWLEQQGITYSNPSGYQGMYTAKGDDGVAVFSDPDRAVRYMRGEDVYERDNPVSEYQDVLNQEANRVYILDDKGNKTNDFYTDEQLRFGMTPEEWETATQLQIINKALQEYGFNGNYETLQQWQTNGTQDEWKRILRDPRLAANYAHIADQYGGNFWDDDAFGRWWSDTDAVNYLDVATSLNNLTDDAEANKGIVDQFLRTFGDEGTGYDDMSKYLVSQGVVPTIYSGKGVDDDGNLINLNLEDMLVMSQDEANLNQKISPDSDITYGDLGNWYTNSGITDLDDFNAKMTEYMVLSALLNNGVGSDAFSKEDLDLLTSIDRSEFGRGEGYSYDDIGYYPDAASNPAYRYDVDSGEVKKIDNYYDPFAIDLETLVNYNVPTKGMPDQLARIGYGYRTKAQ